MKASKLLAAALALALAGIAGSGCSQKYETVVEGANMQSVDYIVKSNQWIESDGYYTVQLDCPQITASIVNRGAVQVTRRLDGDTPGSVYWTPLPIVRAEYDEAEDILYSTYIDYEWTVGKVFVYVTATDFYTGERPADMYFRVNIFF